MKKTTPNASTSNTTTSKKNQNSILAARRKVQGPPPTETERLLAKVLDCNKTKKHRPKKRSKNTHSTAKPASTSASASDSVTVTPQGWSNFSFFTGSTSNSNSNSTLFGERPANASGFGTKKKGLLSSSSSNATATALLNNKTTNKPKRKWQAVPPEKQGVSSATPVITNNKITVPAATSQNKTVHNDKENSATKSLSVSKQQAIPATKSTRMVANTNPYQKRNVHFDKKNNDLHSFQATSRPSLSRVLQEKNEAANESTAASLFNDTHSNSTKTTDTNIAGIEHPISHDNGSLHQMNTCPDANSSDNNNLAQAENTNDDTSTVQLSLNLPISRHQRRKRQRSIMSVDPTTASIETKKDDDLQVLGAMLSSVTANAKTGSINLPTSTTNNEQTSTTRTIFPTTTMYDPLRDNGVTADKPVRLLPPMKPLLPATTDNDNDNDTKSTKTSSTRKPTANNDNFVRQNLRNSAGACRGARNKKRPSKWDQYKKGKTNYGYGKGSYNQHNKNDNSDDDATQDRRPVQQEVVIQRAETFRVGVDPLDDYLDGTLKISTTKTKTSSVSDTQAIPAPQCTRHQRPCKLLVVKKTATGNKGRKFYCCSMPRGEQCDHFQWADDTVEAAKIVLLKNASHSGFMARQVAAYTERFKKLTVPELREAAKRRKLDSTGKKQQLLFRLSVWVRDELASVAPKDADTDKFEVIDTKRAKRADAKETGNNSDSLLLDSGGVDVSGLETDNVPESDEGDIHSDCSSSEDELEFFGAAPTKTSKTDGTTAKAKDYGREEEEEEEDAFSETDSIQSESPEVDIPLNPIEATLFKLFGYRHLKKGQEWAINRCLEKKKSLLVAPTGFGKSMCYVLPAHLMDGICIVVSPLISLIQDQLRELPPRVPAATLSGSLTTAATAAIVDDVIRKRIKILFVSPERLASASFQRLFQPKWNEETKKRERPFPAVSLLCVDEAHCLSQWGHNFRPSYLRLRSIMHKIAPQSVLAITATAGYQVIDDICRTLGIEQSKSVLDGPDHKSNSTKDATDNLCGVLKMKTDRENIDVKSFMVGSQELRLSMLVKLLKPSKDKSGTQHKGGDIELAEGSLARGSVIVYVWRQRDAEVVAESIQASGVTGGVVYYHGGMDSSKRANAYSKFMRGKARICVATVAFGLGVNKPDIAGIIHMYLPASPENHLQEIGRAGRDGRPAQAIALVVEEEALVRHSQSHSDLVSRSQIRSLIFAFRQLVRQTIASIDCGEDWAQVAAIGVAVPLQMFSAACDCKTETLETIFSLLELKEESPTPSIQVEGVTLDKVTISLKRRKIEALMEHETVASVIQKIAICVDAPAGEKKDDQQSNFSYERENSRRQQFAAYSFGSYCFSVTDCANNLGPAAQPRHVFAALRRLQSNGDIELTFDKTAAGSSLRLVLNRSGIQLFHGSEDDDGQQLEDLASLLTEDMNSIATASANKVLDINYIMRKVSDVNRGNKIASSGDESCGDDDVDNFDEAGKSASLVRFQELTGKYFETPQHQSMTEEEPENRPAFVTIFSEKEILIDAMSVISDLLQYPNNGAGEDSLQLGNPATLDYTALAVTKFFHGIATVRSPMALCRFHRLFGKWQAIHFGTLLETVQKVLSHAK